MKNFKIDKQNWKSISIESISYIRNEAKDYLDYTLNESDKITNRAYSIVLMLFAILSTITGYTFIEILNSDSKGIIILNSILIITLGFIIFQFGILVFPRTIMAKGRIPRNLALPQFLNNPKLNNEEIHLSFIIQDVEVLQEKIDFNLLKNESRQNRLKNNLIAMAIIFPLYLVIAFFTTM